ncbi:bifunctional 4-hydroxy-2-oxoglutarate aldolase/2-dehydro-3-deoxy-phosphogluconate aldolase [Enterococcus dongliensis]|uniref:bifunctional 4-hydroxy-2-oxoglutarate aldolase/2-dehydro-3-deoxy-phosphogluconate aldolase n=1 Tax=Enterococcus dongliensis TaxID=2559925 RepID=UPI00288F2B20|nr:bifunctional 4-hydroxy-2-oxoglutarate aldolase/2-dehydro-3-deoxy-phosphogluconate aldolase [Enterococcus dongliensis]MDT2614201.1 bifunctional 4-hydroxy-2-oxoglutarate aldolase/2-dehydro-3-deoxy-phosphogluconate aldolase [Enterococcus dongliensis]MDT2639342.1 bifunctional 4-hydroxy-2-oxoglutarate aldolase/2-dehydro-3-deoxy-phosphogluconate aldolase [Enterococcus dongliensis]
MSVNMNHPVYEQLEKTKLLPLYTATDLSYLAKVEELLLENNVPLIEVTFRSELAVEAIKQLSKSGKIMVGAGTVRTLAEAKNAVENGAQFVVSPAVVPEVIEYCLAQDIPVFPGTATPRDIQSAAAYGIKVVKFFPADIYGGLKAINALSGPFYDIRFLPTGGINENNFVEYLENPHVLGVGGSFILSEKIVKEDNGERMSQILQSLVEKIK